MDRVAQQPAFRAPDPEGLVVSRQAPSPTGSDADLASPRDRGAWSGLRRPRRGRALAGVATALSDALGVTATAMRVAFVALSFVGGTGLAAYVALWLFIPAEGETRAIAPRAMGDRRTLRLALAAGSGIAAVMVAAGLAGVGAPLGMVAPGGVGLAGLVVVRRHAGADDRKALERLANQLSGTSSRPSSSQRRVITTGLRLLAGVVLVATGSTAFLAPEHLTSADLRVLLGALAVLGGFALVLAPWWLRLGRELAAERRERARAEERAEVAAHLHDSVLQTLALIQRNADNSQQVRRLARAQERELRAWLFGGAPAGPLHAGVASSLAEALASIQRDIEADHGVRVEVVTVGNCPVDPRLGALVAAAREATVNAAKWSGADTISVFAEVEERSVSVFVRDRGQGFDPDVVPPDRKGISESISARVARNGGKATVRSKPNEGTEVALMMPRWGAQ